jgi:hypothetical protein
MQNPAARIRCEKLSDAEMLAFKSIGCPYWHLKTSKLGEWLSRPENSFLSTVLLRNGKSVSRNGQTGFAKGTIGRRNVTGIF